ncbi:MAG: ABC transporter ATP-binding protein [Dactylosporangium sp.]|nr:ABC transporter ATP-binding protein [Dactylosporangium sp.]NNJ63380.1 ABC transporter ATP-binding protein [Dactylosporangium sp.]
MELPGTGDAAPPPIAEPVLVCDGLRKHYGERPAVSDVAFTIAPGETYGLLGPNGAGKTTTILMIAGVLQPDAGTILVSGIPMALGALAAKARIGFVPQEIAIYPDLTARENLRLFARLCGLGRGLAKQRTEEILETIGLRDRGAEQTKRFSGGMQRRLNIGIGLLHAPALLILDEPTVGVDPQSRNAILESIEALSTDGMAVLYTTHYMEEAQRLCDRIGIMDAGSIVAHGTQRELTALVGQSDRIRLTASGDLAGAAEALRALPSVQRAEVAPEGLELLDPDARTALPGLLRTATDAGAVVRSVAVQEPDLEAVFLHLTGKSLRD